MTHRNFAETFIERRQIMPVKNTKATDVKNVSLDARINDLIVKSEKWNIQYHTAQLGLYAILHGCFVGFKNYQTSTPDDKKIIRETLATRYGKTKSAVKTKDIATMIIGCVFEKSELSKDQRFNNVNTIKRADGDSKFGANTSEEDFVAWVDQAGGTHNIARRKPPSAEQQAELNAEREKKAQDAEHALEVFFETALENRYVVSKKDFAPKVSTNQLCVVLGKQTDDGFLLSAELTFQQDDIVKAVKSAIAKEVSHSIKNKNKDKKKEVEKQKSEAQKSELREQGKVETILVSEILNDEYLKENIPNATDLVPV